MQQMQIASPNSSKTIGIIALITTVLVWSGFFLSLRFGAKVKVPPLEIAVLRFLPGTLVFLPILFHSRKRIFSAPKWPMLLMIIGSGFPYLFVAGVGMTMVPVADGSTLLPGLNPVFVSLLGLLVFGRKIPRARLIALSIILLGVGSMIIASVNHPSGVLLEGLLILIAASLMWATFTLAFEKSGLKPIEGAAVVTFGSIPLLAASLLWRNEPLKILEVAPSSLLPLILAQGIGVGLLSTISYTTAIKNLGALPASLVGALTPVFSTLLAMVLLSETPVLLTLGGMLFVVLGVYLANIR